ncbi:aminotransferase class I/II-fold pyridoxal phosphate-dependent enzyme [Polaromonas sp. YR568]|uniref:aminotransferase class I/II-fold pyridoxal phosphate-dependent enzyme n=1 Tax=Polaromonas sp. YR568 TaxID=1855301 RepID=UPI003138093A
MTTRLHGGPDHQGVPLHDFSTNSNACGPCPAALAAVQRADATRYPDAGYTALRAQLAAFHGVDSARVLLAASASEFIFRVTALVAGRGGRAVWLPPHSYCDYVQAAHANRLTVTAQPRDAQLLWACEPSSPMGCAHAGLAQLADGIDAHAMVVLDRAYEPLRLSGTPSPTPETAWQLWTPNKALGLTGVRAAYVIAPPGQCAAVAALEELSPSWPIGAHGVAMLQAWVSGETQDWLQNSLDTLRTWKARQIGLCESWGWHVLPSETNFFCARPSLPAGIDLPQALAVLRAQGIKLRDTTSFGLPGHVRVSVQQPAVQDALHNAWQQLLTSRQ